MGAMFEDETVDIGNENKDDGKYLKKLLSEQHSRTLFVFSEGECESVLADLTHLYLNDTPVGNGRGGFNFEKGDFEVQTRTGTKNQTVMSGFQNSEKEIPVGVDLKDEKPVIRTVTDPHVKKVRITVGVKGLYYQPEGVADTWGTSVIILVHAGSRSQQVKFEGLSRDQYLQQVEFDVSELTVPFNIKVERINEDSPSMRKQDDTFWASYTEIIPSNLNYPHTALLGLQLNSKSFSSFPRVNALMRGIKVHVPSNYNPYSRTYSGLWDGRFKRAWTNNPAWIYYDLIMNPRYGLSKRIWSFACDKWALYAVARYCDEIVPDGFGGSEPRFTCNVAIQSQRQAYDLLNDLASTFRGMPVWDGTQFAVIQDRPADPVWIYTNANVVNGEFSYASAGLKARHNALHVEYLDKNDHYRKKTEYVADDQMIARYQLNVKKVVAFGCTSRGQAYRTGRWILETEKLESKTVTFSVGLEGLKHVPSDIIEIADENYAGTKIGGRVLSVKGLSLELDREIEYVAGAFLRIHAKNGQIQRVNIVAVEGQTVTLANGVEVEPMSVWTYHGKIKPRLFRCLSIEEKDGTYAITALQHEPQKERIVDTGANFERVEYTAFSAPKLTHLSVSSLPGGGLSISWNSTAANAGKVTYEVKVMKDGRVFAIYKDLTSLDLALQDLPNGEYTIIISIIGERGQILDQKQDVFVVDRPPVPQEVMISSGLTDITLTWQFVDKYTHTEIWAHTQDNQADALMVGKVFGSTFTHNIGAEQVRYYWVRHTRGQNVGYFHQERGLRGETAVDIDKELNVLNKKLSKNIVNQVIDTALPARGLEPVKKVSGLNVNQFLGNKLVHNQLDGRLYVWNGTKYVYKTPSSDIEGNILPEQLAQIPTTKLSGQLTDSQIQTINAAKIEGHIVDSQISAVDVGKLRGVIPHNQLAQIPTEKLSGKIAAEQIQANAIGVNHIAAGVLTADKLAVGMGGNLLYNPIFANPTNGVPHGWSKGGFLPLSETTCHQDSAWGFKSYLDNENLIRWASQNDEGNTGYCDLRQKVSVGGGVWYALSAYVGNHRCNLAIYLQFFDASGDHITAPSLLIDNRNLFNGVNSARRAFLKAQAPGNAATVDVIIRKFATEGSGSNSFMFVGRPMLEECTPHTTEPSVWQNAGVTAIHGGSIVTESVVADKIATNAIQTQHLQAGAVNADKIAANSVRTVHIVANAITSVEIAAGAVNTDQLAANSVSAAKMQANSIGANHLQANAVIAGKIAANAVTTVTIQANAVRTEHLAAGQISADKMAIGLGGNLLYNPIFSNPVGGVPHGWSIGGNGASTITDKQAVQDANFGFKSYLQNENIIRIATANDVGQAKYVDVTQNVAVNPGVWYALSAYVGNHRCRISVYLQYLDKNNSPINAPNYTLTEDHAFVGIASANRVFLKAQAPSNAASVNVIIRKFATNAGQTNSYLFLGRPMLEECTQYTANPSVWQNAGVTSIHGGSIITETVTAQKLAADSVTANKIAAGAVATHHIAANTINANHVRTKALNADKLNIQKLSAISADLGDIRAGSININNRFIVGGDGRVEIRNQPGNVGMVINNDNISVYDAAGRLRVKLGRLS